MTVDREQFRGRLVKSVIEPLRGEVHPTVPHCKASMDHMAEEDPDLEVVHLEGKMRGRGLIGKLFPTPVVRHWLVRKK